LPSVLLFTDFIKIQWVLWKVKAILDFKLSPCSEYSMPLHLQHHFKPSAYKDGTDRVFRNVGNYKSDAGESPKRRHTIFKAIPLQAWTGLEGSRRLRLPDFMTIGTWS
jgi:hypothetical protein